MGKLRFALYAILLLFVEISLSQSCNGAFNLQNESGYITSNIGGTYLPSSSCYWYLTPPNSSYTYVTITFINFETESYWDPVTIYNGNTTNSPKLAQYSGYSLPYPSSIQSTQSDLTITFSSDNIIQYTGFSLYYQYQTGAPPPCGGITTLPSGDSSFSLDFPTLEGTSFECDYIIPSIYTDSNYEYTSYVWLESITDPSLSLYIAVYAGPSINSYSSPAATYISSSSLGCSSSINYYSQAPSLYIRVMVSGNNTTNETTSFAVQYSFEQGAYTGGDPYAYTPPNSDNFLGIFFGCFFGGFFLLCLIVFGFVFGCRRNRGGTVARGGLFYMMFNSSSRNQPTTTTTTTTTSDLPPTVVQISSQPSHQTYPQQPVAVQPQPYNPTAPVMQGPPAYVPPVNPELVMNQPLQYYPPQVQPLQAPVVIAPTQPQYPPQQTYPQPQPIDYPTQDPNNPYPYYS